MLDDEKMSDNEKYQLIHNIYTPTKQEIRKYPVFQTGKNRCAQHHWLIENKPFLTFSHVRQGFLCLPCAMFRPLAVGKGGHQTTGYFVTTAYRRYKDFGENWKNHINSQFHKFCIEQYGNFIKTSGPDSTRKPNIIEANTQGLLGKKEKARKQLGVILKGKNF